MDSNPTPNGTADTTQSAPQTPDWEAQVKEKEAKYLYLYAEFENYKKRAIKERSELLKFGFENPARDLLLVLDNLDRALQHTPAATDKNLIEGLKMVQNQFEGTLQRLGVQVMQTQGQVFDPNLHEGVGQTESDLPSGTIVSEELKGYTMHGRLLRPARVVVSAGKMASA